MVLDSATASLSVETFAVVSDSAFAAASDSAFAVASDSAFAVASATAVAKLRKFSQLTKSHSLSTVLSLSESPTMSSLSHCVEI